MEEALGTIKGLALTTVNYEEALCILGQRYGSKQVIVNSHMDALKQRSQTKKIRALYD